MDRICLACRRVGFQRRRRQESRDLPNLTVHHQAFDTLEEAAAKGCPICLCLWQSLSDEQISILRKPRTVSAPLISWFSARSHGYNYLSPGWFIFDIGSESFQKVLGFQKLEASGNPPHSTGSDQALKQAAKWISHCIRNHDKCIVPLQSKDSLPTRLLYVGSLGDPTIKLCHSEFLAECVRYTTLSHCWGPKPIISLKKDTISTFESGIDVQCLPKTFRDAVHVTRTLEVNYIWIDSLCIIQDSKGDWQKEAVRMHSVYHYSYCNIAATKSPDSEGGCFTERPNYDPSPVILNSTDRPFADPENIPSQGYESIMGAHQFEYLRDKSIIGALGSEGDTTAIEDAAFGRNTTPACSTDAPGTLLDGFGKPIHPLGPPWFELEHLWNEEVAKSVLMSRAWVFQERLLAPRVLHFANIQIFFECRQACGGELHASDYLDRPPIISSAKSWVDHLGPNPTETGAVLRRWERLVSQYNACSLTYESDRFIAIAGLAKQLQPILDCKYFAGLWEHRLPQQLTWISSSPFPDYVIAKPPTWSWATRPGSINSPTTASPISRWTVPAEDMVIEEVSVVTVDGNEMSQVLSGEIRVTARLIPTRYIDKIQVGIEHWADVLGELDKSSTAVNIRGTNYPFWPDTEMDESDDALFATICVYEDSPHRPKEEGLVRGLVLKPTGQKAQYHRVGCFASLYECILDELLCEADAVEKAQLRDDSYEKYHEDLDKYAFTIV